MTSENRARALLKKMTLREKIGQLSMRPFAPMEAQGVPYGERLLEWVKDGKVGALIQPCADMTEEAEKWQRLAVESSRHGIPLLFNSDVLHGFETVFPIPLAAACSFDPALVEETAKASAREMRAGGIRYNNAPMVDVARDPRWGRICECQGEDPYLAGEMAKAYVRGFQNAENYVMATLKHYAAYGACEGGRDYDVAEVCENTMLNCYLIPFREGVAAGADSVMSSFNSIENIPATGNKKYLKDILRGKFGFDGVTLSDAMSVPEMTAHGYCETAKDCAYRAMKAGLDMEMGTDCYPDELEGLVNAGEISEAEIDEAAFRVLKKKFELGLFDDPYGDFHRDKSVIYCKEHLELSEKLALESAVLLENDGVLPLQRNAKLAVVGAFADNPDLCGAWQNSSRQGESVTVLRGLRAQGFEIVGVSESYALAAAERAAKNADVVIFTLGETQDENGEAHSKHDIGFSQTSKRCFARLRAMGKKVVTLVFAGRPMLVNEFAKGNALAFCWNLGQRTGTAVAKLLAGEANFSGKLVVTVPRSTGQLPLYYNRRNVGRPFLPDRQDYRFQVRYDDGENYPQYPFGYGLSYSRFVYGKAWASGNTLERGGALTVSAEVENGSGTDGVEIVQLYIKDRFSEVVRPMRELKDFARVPLKAGEKETVSFVVTEEKLAYYHADGALYADTGDFVLYIGGDSRTENGVEIRLAD